MTERVQSILTRLSGLTHAAANALETADPNTVDKLDQEIELSLGEKEQALGALKEHQIEHGC